MTNEYTTLAAINGKSYLISAKKIFQNDSPKMIRENHYQHNMEPNYWNIMLKDLLENEKFIGKNLLGVWMRCG